MKVQRLVHENETFRAYHQHYKLKTNKKDVEKMI